MTAELVTLIPPGTGGVRDYAEIMARHVPTRILAPTPETPLAEYGSGDVMLHFSGYGYQSRGVPTWLVKRLRQIKSKKRKVGVFFHELFATSPPWRSAFWLHIAQRKIAADLAELADFWMTNRESSEIWLKGHASHVPHLCLPVYSNVGEPEAAMQPRHARKLVIFGGPGSRTLAYRDLDDQFWQWCKKEGFEVHDVGPALEAQLHRRLNDTQTIHWHGEIPAEQVSRLLLESTFGIVSYPTAGVSKSGVFAAYCAHGVCPVLLARSYHVHDGLHANVHYLAGVSALTRGQADAHRIGIDARNWYLPHDVQAHARALQSLLRAARESVHAASS